jgi:hypothetical protein
LPNVKDEPRERASSENLNAFENLAGNNRVGSGGWFSMARANTSNLLKFFVPTLARKPTDFFRL